MMRANHVIAALSLVAAGALGCTKEVTVEQPAVPKGGMVEDEGARVPDQGVTDQVKREPKDEGVTDQGEREPKREPKEEGRLPGYEPQAEPDQGGRLPQDEGAMVLEKIRLSAPAA